MNKEKNILTNFIAIIIYKYLMSKSAVKMTGRLAGFDPSAYANEFITADEVLEIKRAFDLFDYDGGGSIDPKGKLSFI